MRPARPLHVRGFPWLRMRAPRRLKRGINILCRADLGPTERATSAAPPGPWACLKAYKAGWPKTRRLTSRRTANLEGEEFLRSPLTPTIDRQIRSSGDSGFPASCSASVHSQEAQLNSRNVPRRGWARGVSRHADVMPSCCAACRPSHRRQRCRLITISISARNNLAPSRPSGRAF
jgi:hypothetical protein